MCDLDEQRLYFEKLYVYVLNNPRSEYTLCYGEDQIISAQFDTAYEVENGCDYGEEGYEEYYALRFRISLEYQIGPYLEITYQNIPDHVFCADQQIY